MSRLDDIASDTSRQLTDNTISDTQPQLYSGQVVWTGHDGHDQEIFYMITRVNVNTGVWINWGVSLTIVMIAWVVAAIMVYKKAS